MGPRGIRSLPPRAGPDPFGGIPGIARLASSCSPARPPCRPGPRISEPSAAAPRRSSPIPGPSTCPRAPAGASPPKDPAKSPSARRREKASFRPASSAPNRSDRRSADKGPTRVTCATSCPDGAGGEPARRRGDHALRPLVELPAAQARPRRPPGGIPAGGDLLSPAPPAAGYAVQRVYTDDRSLDETIAVSDGDVVLVPRGYHQSAPLTGTISITST